MKATENTAAFLAGGDSRGPLESENPPKHGQGGKNMLFTLLGEQCLVQTIEETDFRTSVPIALFLWHCRRPFL